MLNISEKKLENATMELTIDVPLDKVEMEYKAAYIKLQHSAKIDGFRKGKAPLAMVEARFRKEADREVAENLLRNLFLQAIEEKQITPIAYPKYEFDKISREEPFSFKAIFEIPPTVEIGKYKGIAADERVCVVIDEDVVREIDSIRERFATVTKKEEADAVVNNSDLVKLKVKRIDDIDEGMRDSVEFKEYSIVVGRSKDESALDKYITGMKNGEQKEIDVKYPKDYYLADLAGQKVTYHVIIAEISTMELPELNDEFAKKLGYESVSEFNAKTKNYLEKYVTERIKGDAKSEILKQIVDGSTFDIPESMIMNEMANLFKKTRESVGYQSDDIENFAAMMGIDIETFKKRLHEEAAQTIKTTLALSEIAKKEELKVDENRYKEVVENIAKRNNKTVDEIEKFIAEHETRDTIEMELLLDGAMELIYDNAKLKKLKQISFEEFLNLRNN